MGAALTQSRAPDESLTVVGIFGKLHLQLNGRGIIPHNKLNITMTVLFLITHSENVNIKGNTDNVCQMG